MRGVMTIIRSNESVEVTSLDRTPTLDELQAAVGGYIEMLTISTYQGKLCTVFCNEHGKINNLPYNPKATTLYWEAVPTSDPIVGDIVILTGDDEFLASL